MHSGLENALVKLSPINSPTLMTDTHELTPHKDLLLTHFYIVPRISVDKKAELQHLAQH